MASHTLKELSILYAKKQPKWVEYLIEECPFLDIVPFSEASHGLWHVYEEVESVTGADWAAMNAPLTTVDVTSELKKLDLNIMGGQMECPEDKAKLFGGKEKYFARKIPTVLKKSGMTAEARILYENLRQYAIDQGENINVLDAGGSTNACYSIVAVRFEPDVVGGLYSPDGFKQGAMLDTMPISGGNLYLNSGGVLVYGVRLKAYFGFQIASPRNVAVIVNIQSGNKPTEAQMDDLVNMVRGTPANTKLVLHPKCLTFLNAYKEDALQVNVRDKDMDRRIKAWNGIPFLETYNMLDGTEDAVTF